MTPPPCCDGCGKVTSQLTGLGSTQVEWLCIDCLEAAVAALGEKLRRFIQAKRN